MMREQNHKPLRTCLGCRQRDFKAEMVRVALTPDGAAVADWRAVMPGRGGYLHRRAACLEQFGRSKMKESRSLRRRLEVGERRALANLIGEVVGSESLSRIL